MSVRYKYSGLTKELYQRLVSEHAALKQAHPKDYKQFFEVDRITLEYRTKGKVGRNKTSVRKALYTAYMLVV